MYITCIITNIHTVTVMMTPICIIISVIIKDTVFTNASGSYVFSLCGKTLSHISLDTIYRYAKLIMYYVPCRHLILAILLVHCIYSWLYRSTPFLAGDQTSCCPVASLYPTHCSFSTGVSGETQGEKNMFSFFFELQNVFQQF